MFNDQQISDRINQIDRFEADNTANIDDEARGVIDDLDWWSPSIEQVRACLESCDNDLDMAINTAADSELSARLESLAYPEGRLPHQKSYGLLTDVISVAAIFERGE